MDLTEERYSDTINMFGGPVRAAFLRSGRPGRTADKKEMTLDDFGVRFFSSRVISVLSYYLTSLVTSDFCSIEQILYSIWISLLFGLFRTFCFLAFPLLPHIRMNTFAVSFRLLRIRSIAFCCFSNGSFRFSAGLRHFFFDQFEFLHLASFLICFCFFWILLLFFPVAFGFLDFARFRFLQLLF